MNELVSILLANYNNARYLSEAIDCVIRQSWSNWEIVVVDDGSKDHSIDVINTYIKKGLNIRLFRNKANQGCGATKHDCVLYAKGDICGFLDPDDLLTDNALEIMVEAHRDNPEASLIYSTHYFCSPDMKEKTLAWWVKPIPQGKTNLHADIIHHFVTFKKRLYDLTEGINKRYISAVDKDLYYKLEEQGPAIFIDRPLYYYRENEAGMSQFWKYSEAQENHLMVIRDALERRKRNGFKSLNFFQYRKVKSRIRLQQGEILMKLGAPVSSVTKWLVRSFLCHPLLYNHLRVKYFILSCFRSQTIPKV
ncbi:MAG: glycosyltransferase family 2 protein [Bacteroidia bacterium]|nr:glycosyltransferase family 2 protein [Bacteroidia bacterium]